jgi:uncharacterized integral membrane protein
MSFAKIVKWLFRIILIILTIVLLFDNIQNATFSFFGIYQITLPLIVLILIFLIIGIIIGYSIALIKSYKKNK